MSAYCTNGCTQSWFNVLCSNFQFPLLIQNLASTETLTRQVYRPIQAFLPAESYKLISIEWFNKKIYVQQTYCRLTNFHGLVI